MIKRIGDDEEDMKIIINFAEINGLTPALKRALKEYDIKL